jgi:hypothetical protein
MMKLFLGLINQCLTLLNVLIRPIFQYKSASKQQKQLNCICGESLLKKGVTHEETEKNIVEQVESDTDEEDQPMEFNARKKKKTTAKNKPDQATDMDFDIENEEEPRRSTRF